MIPESQLRKHLVIPEQRHAWYLKDGGTAFNFALLTLGCFEAAAAARLFGMKSDKTIKRARSGQAISDDLMANALAAFKLNADRLTAKGIKVEFDTFFVEAPREDHDQVTDELVEAVA